MNDLTEEEVNLLTISKDMITMREEYIDATVAASMAAIDFAAAEDILQNYLTISTSKTPGVIILTSTNPARSNRRPKP